MSATHECTTNSERLYNTVMLVHRAAEDVVEEGVFDYPAAARVGSFRMESAACENAAEIGRIRGLVLKLQGLFQTVGSGCQILNGRGGFLAALGVDVEVRGQV